MTPTQEAKAKVAKIFAALSAYPLDAKWDELVRGGYEANVNIVSGQLLANVGDDGEYAVYFEKNGMRLHTLASGSFSCRTVSNQKE